MHKIDVLTERKINRCQLWCIVMALGLVVLFITMLFTNGQTFLDLTYSNPRNTFFDFTYSMLAAHSRKEYNSMYPPFAQMFFHVLICLIPGYSSKMTAKKLITYPLGALYVLFFFLCCTLFISWIIDDQLKEKKWLKRCVLLLLIFSAPYIYEYQRGNVLIIVVPLICFFMFYYDSERISVRALASFALAVAAGFKMYPAILGMILLTERRWKQAIMSVIMGLAVLILPAFYFQGFSTLRQIALALFSTTTEITERGVGHQLSLINFARMINQAFGCSLNEKLFMLIMVVFMIATYFIAKEKWQKAAVLCAAMVTWPSISFQYTMILMTLPLLMFFSDQKITNKWDILYVCLLAFCFMVIPLGGQNAFSFTEGQYYTLNITTILENIAINALIVTIFIHSFSSRNKEKKRELIH